MGFPARLQPQGRQQIARNNPITAGLLFAFNGTGIDVVSGRRATNLNLVGNPKGLGHQVAGSSNVAQIAGLNWPATNTVTIFSLLLNVTVGGGYQGIIGKWDGLNGSRFGLGFENGNLALTRYASGSSDATFGAVVSAQTMTLAAVQDATGAQGYLNGALLGTNGAGYSIAQNTDSWYIGCFRGGATNENLPATNVLSLVFNRALSAREIKSLHDNPWQVFEAPAVYSAAPMALGAANLSGSATAVASAYGQLSTAITLSGAIQAVASTGIAAGGAGPAVLVVPVSGSVGALSMAVQSAGTAVTDMTAAGKVDWIVYPNATPVRKNGGGSQIGVAHVGSFSDNVATDAKESVAWSDGAGTVSGNSNGGLIFSSTGDGVGYSVTLPADTTPRVATVILGVYNTRMRITATLSDGSASQQVDTSIISDSSGGTVAIVTLNYSAASAGQTLTVTGVQISPSGYANTSFQGAAFSLAASAAVLGGSVVASASAGGALSTAIPLSGSAQARATASGALTTAIKLTGGAAAVASAFGTLSTAIPLSGSAATVASLSGSLGGTVIALSGSVVAQASAGGTLTTAIPLSGYAAGVATASGALTTAIKMSGSVVGAASAGGALSTAIPLSGSAAATATVTGNLGGNGVALVGAVAASATASGALSTAIPLVGGASARATSTGALSTQIVLAGTVGAVATVTGQLTTNSRGTDISQIDPAHIAVFEGTGSRIAVFGGTGSRVAVFDGTGARTVINGITMKLPTIVNGKMTTDRDLDEISWYGADITQELSDRATTPLDVSKLMIVLAGVAMLEGPLLQTAVKDSVTRTYVVVRLGPVDGALPANWGWIARVPCANGERFDKSTFFNQVDT